MTPTGLSAYGLKLSYIDEEHVYEGRNSRMNLRIPKEQVGTKCSNAFISFFFLPLSSFSKDLRLCICTVSSSPKRLLEMTSL